jgi:hypothetical protein
MERPLPAGARDELSALDLAAHKIDFGSVKRLCPGLPSITPTFFRSLWAIIFCSRFHGMFNGNERVLYEPICLHQ